LLVINRTVHRIRFIASDFPAAVRNGKARFPTLLISPGETSRPVNPEPDEHLPLLGLGQAMAKRATDMLLAGLGLVLLLPLLLIVGLLVKVSSPGPVLYRQERIGKGSIPFSIYKFRSMYADAEKNGPALSCDRDPRVTPWGRIMRKVHLDELPQLYNVLCGHMSLVGPRPERQYFIDLILEQAPHYRQLLRVRPGITSLGLVKYGYARNVEEMVRRMSYDITYMENMSLAMDLRVMLYTFKVIVKGGSQIHADYTDSTDFQNTNDGALPYGQQNSRPAIKGG
jgi:lipopolysaccharide/colanic/teichoic acid biosynthesis glycosyltransferase